MPYLQSYRGDYLSGYRGDPGLFGFIKKVGRGLASGLSLLPGPIGTVASKFAGRGRQPRQAMPGGRSLEIPTGLQVPGLTVYGGKKGKKRAGFGFAEAPRRRMNVGNAKALRRAIRRTDGFVKLAKRALKNTGWTVTRRGTGRKPVRIVEHGPGSVTVQR